MPEIETYPSQILSAVYGRDVRQAIRNAIEQCYLDGKTGAIDLLACQQLNALVASSAGVTGGTTLWEGYAAGEGYELTLAADPLNYDYIEVHYIYRTRIFGSLVECPGNLLRFDANDFANGSAVIVNFSNTGGSGVQATETHLVRMGTSDMPDANLYRITMARYMTWSGNAADDAVKNAVETTGETSDRLAGCITKIVGVKRVNDAEVEDLRIGADGVTYLTAGEAVRAQLSAISEQIGTQVDGISIEDGKIYLTHDGTHVSSGTDLIGNKSITGADIADDTGMGNDNEGGLTLKYGYLDIDAIGTRNVFNAADSALWALYRECYETEIRAMYLALENAGCFNLDAFADLCDVYQNYACEALWIEDAWRKSIDPFNELGTTAYIPMLNGKKRLQRRQFLHYQRAFMGSYFNDSYAVADTATISELTDVSYNKYVITEGA